MDWANNNNVLWEHFVDLRDAFISAKTEERDWSLTRWVADCVEFPLRVAFVIAHLAAGYKSFEGDFREVLPVSVYEGDRKSPGRENGGIAPANEKGMEPALQDL